jgi:hypothetical protein
MMEDYIILCDVCWDDIWPDESHAYHDIIGRCDKCGWPSGRYLIDSESVTL